MTGHMGAPFEPPTPRRIDVDESTTPQALCDSIMNDSKPGDFRYGTITMQPGEETRLDISNPDLMFAVQLGGDNDDEVRTWFMSRFPPALSIQMLTDLIDQIRSVNDHESSRN